MISSSPIRKRTTTKTTRKRASTTSWMTKTRVISAGGAIEEEKRDDVDEAGDGAADRHVHEARGYDGIVRAAEPAPPTDGRARRIWQPPADALPAAAVAHRPRPSTSPFASRLGPAPIGSPYAGRATGTAMPAIQVPPPSGEATTATGPGFFTQAGADGHRAVHRWRLAAVRLRRSRILRRQEHARAGGGRREAGRRAGRVRSSNPCRADSPPLNPEPKPADTTAIAKPATAPGTEIARRATRSRRAIIRKRRMWRPAEEADRGGEAAQAAGRHGRRRQCRGQAETRHREGAQASRDAGRAEAASPRRSPSPRPPPRPSPPRSRPRPGSIRSPTSRP